MEIGTANHEKAGLFACWWRWLKGSLMKLYAKLVEVARMAKKLGEDDPRRVFHSLKVGIALTFVSLFFYFQPLYDNFGVSAMWAVMTVVVVFEFSVGATLGKGLNRGLATSVAGALGVGAHYLASLSGSRGEPILLGFFVFLQAAASTFIRFFPRVKARYDYGLVIFILTFCFVSVSGYREEEIIKLARKRLVTVLLGSSICVIISIFVYPVWAGEDLHNLVSLNIEKLGMFMEGFGGEYFGTSEGGESKDDKLFLQGYKSVLNSKSNEESLANFAKWEPPHGRFVFRHPWKQYLKVGTLTRQCAYRLDALNGCLMSDAKEPTEIRRRIKESCTKMSWESGKALNEVASAIKTMTHPLSADPHIVNAKQAAKTLKSLLKSDIWKDIDLLQVVPVVTVASILIDVVICTDKIAESVHELASLAHFKTIEPSASPEKSQLDQFGSSKPVAADLDCAHDVIVVKESAQASSGNDNDPPLPFVRHAEV